MISVRLIDQWKFYSNNNIWSKFLLTWKDSLNNYFLKDKKKKFKPITEAQNHTFRQL